MRCGSALIAAWILLGCASAREPAQAESRAGVINFADTTHGLRMTYPARWQEQRSIRPRGGIVVLVRSDIVSDAPPTVSIVANVEPGDLRMIERHALDKARSTLDDFDWAESSDTSVAGEPARRIVYTGKRDATRIRVMNVIVMHAGNAYAISYVAEDRAFDEARGDVETMIASIAFMK